MRNLQKILALALALMMSFSLVVTANAAFSDDADINETYSESVNVLAQLEVFKGYNDGSYQPKADITRAEVAAIIYRIATGDVTDSQVSLYSDWNRFKDVSSESWYAGYVNYCANAEYIKGYGDGNFRPQQNVTGYEALAMILRAVGYGKMDEFVGSDWAVNTAARANTLKISRNVTAALLGSPASREVVAELLFRSILVPTVTYNNAFGYQETDTTLAYNSFKLEAIEGVVVANEYANLYDTQVLDAGKTDLEIAKNDIRSLDITSALTDVGESRYAYVSGSKVYALENTGDNVVKETGDHTTIDTDKKFRDFSGLNKTDDTEFYLNFGREGKFSCDYRLEFTVIFYTEDAQKTFTDKYHNVPAYAYDCNTDKDNKDNDWTVRYGTWTQDDKENVTLAYANGEPSASNGAYQFPTAANSFVEYNRIIRAKEEITSEEMDIIEGIFASADNISSNGLDKDKVTGDVYLGTKSNLDKDDKERDISNEISFRKFKDEYINSEIWDQDIENSGNGEWLKIVDNNNDGKAEYAFLTQYWLDKAISSYTKSGETILEFNSVDVEAFEDDDGIIDYVDEIAVNDVVYYTNIDNRITMTKAPVVTAKIKTVNFKDDSCTTTEDATYVESDIFNKSRLDQEVENMDDEVEYNLYFDAYGYVRAYELAQGNTYGLLTELYKTTTQNAQYVKGVDLTAELKKGAEKIDEFDVSNSKDNVFLLGGIAAKENDNNWNVLDTAAAAAAKANSWVYKGVYNVDKDSEILLQPAIGQLGLEYDGDARSAENIFHNVTTNVVNYIETGDGEVRLTSPVKYATDEKGNRLYYSKSDLTGGKYVKGEELSDGSKVSDDYPAYSVDYIALDLSNGLAADARRYDISSQSRYYNQSSKYVNAVHDTEYYVVNTNTKKADYFTDYEKVYAISKDHIIAAYAVAQNTVADHNNNDYWVADVIVIEVSGLDTIFDSVGVLYTNPSQTSGSVKLLKTLNTESENPDIDMIPEDWEWAPQNNGNWVYEIDEKELKDGVLYADTVQYIAQNYNAKGIYAGIVSHVEEVNTRGGYIDVVMSGYDYVNDWVDSVSVTNDQLFAIGSSSGKNYSLRDLRVTRSATTDRVEVGDYVIWGEDKDGHTAFVIDVSFTDGDWKAPTWLTSSTAAVVENGKITNWAADPGLWRTIAEEQAQIKGATTFKAAMDAYNTWVQNKTEDNRKEAVKTINAALKNPKLSDDEKARLEDILKVLGAGTGTDTSDLVAAYNAWNKANLDNASNKNTLKQALYKAAKAHTRGDGTSNADKAYDAAVAQAVADVKAFNSEMSTVTFENIEDAAEIGVTADTLALANTDGANDSEAGSGKEAVKEYSAADGPKAKYEKYAPLYEKAKKLVTEYNAYVRAGVGADKTAVRAAFAAISDAEHTDICKNVGDYSDAYKFGNENGVNYITAYDDINGEINDETAVGNIKAVKLNEELAAKYGATMEKVSSSDTSIKYAIKMTDRAGMPLTGPATPSVPGQNDIVELVGWLGLTLSDATTKTVDGQGSVTLYRLSGDGFVGEGLTFPHVEYMGDSQGNGVYGLVLDVYGSDRVRDYRVMVAFEYTGSTAPDSYNYTADLTNVTGKEMQVALTRDYDAFTSNSAVTKVEFVLAPTFQGDEAVVIATVTSFETFNAANGIVAKSGDISASVTAKEKVYALVYVDGVDEPIKSNTLPYTEMT